MSELSEEYPSIYHYTNGIGLHGILKDKCLWATHFKFLNDYSEINLFKNKFKEQLIHHVKKYLESPSFKNEHDQKIICEGGGIDKVAEDGVTSIIDDNYNVFFNVLKTELYITSFCAANQKDEFLINNGLLSQWRGYGSDGGYAIEFDTLELENQLNPENTKYRIGFTYGNVIYSDDEEAYQKELSGDLDELAKHTVNLFDAIHRKQERPDHPLQSFISCIVRFKHQAFKEENEVRIASIIHDLQDFQDYEDNRIVKERKFRVREGKLIPYIELFKDSGNMLAAIRKIIVGPCKDQKSRVDALNILLKNAHRTDIKVDDSKIPFIS